MFFIFVSDPRTVWEELKLMGPKRSNCKMPSVTIMCADDCILWELFQVCYQILDRDGVCFVLGYHLLPMALKIRFMSICVNLVFFHTFAK